MDEWRLNGPGFLSLWKLWAMDLNLDQCSLLVDYSLELEEIGGKMDEYDPRGQLDSGTGTTVVRDFPVLTLFCVWTMRKRGKLLC